ncbi:MAG TPA: aldolase/citrate lyase family protein [Usitatibacter sp.]|nr:aldolase/citrate lyase family protein [Usitatibacter sp.]
MAIPTSSASVPHPSVALFAGEKAIPVLPACEHFAGSEKLIGKALELQAKVGRIFDVTCDCEDGAAAGQERQHAQMIVDVLGSSKNTAGMAGARIHDYTHAHWREDVDILVGGAGKVLAYITIPKCTTAAQAAEMIDYIQSVAKARRVGRDIPVHVLVETHGALHDAWRIAALPHVQVLDFGLMDFVSGHHGAIHASNMRSPGQFEHPLVVRAKAEVVACALAHGVVPAHNVSLDLRNTYNVFRDAWRARNDFGFLRMWSIHPAQIQPIVDAMKPDLGEVADAANILLAAQRANWGPIQYQGELHDRATYRYFWNLLQKAKVTGVAVPEDASQAFFQDFPLV